MDMDEMILLGVAVLAVQKFEFFLMGLASHVPNETDALKGWSGENFLRGDQKAFKKTLGKLKEHYAEKFLIDNSDLDILISNRNILCHNYYRMVHSNISGVEKLDDPIAFLKKTIELSDHFTCALSGLYHIVISESAKNEGPAYQSLLEVASQTALEADLKAEIEKALKNTSACRTRGIEAFVLSLKEAVVLIRAHPNKQWGQSLIDEIFIKHGAAEFLSSIKESIEGKPNNNI